MRPGQPPYCSKIKAAKAWAANARAHLGQKTTQNNARRSLNPTAKRVDRRNKIVEPALPLNPNSISCFTHPQHERERERERVCVSVL
jgi:hypothetical protein